MVKQRKRCYMDIEVGGVPMGRVVYELFNDLCPITCENFRALCTGEVESGQPNGKPLRYVSSIFHRVVKGFMIQGGDFSASNGTGGESIYGGFFDDENFIMKHDVPYRLSMANRGKNTNGSQFYITTNTAPHLDGIHVVFGEVKVGQNIVKHLESLPVDRSCRPLQDIKIVRSGELVIKPTKRKSPRASKYKKESSSSEESSSDTDSDVAQSSRFKKRLTKEERKIKAKLAKLSEGVDKEEGEVDDNDRHPLVSVSNICPEDIPEVPSNRLLRDNPRNEKKQRSHEAVGRPSSFPYPRASKSGRQIKGRGICRYRTPSPSRDNSESPPRRARTPPHWVFAQRRTIKLSEYQKQEEIKRREEDQKKHEISTINGIRKRVDNVKSSITRIKETPSETQTNKLPLDYNALDYEGPENDIVRAESGHSDGEVMDNSKKQKMETDDDDGEDYCIRPNKVPKRRHLDDGHSTRTKENASRRDRVSHSARHYDDHRSRRRRSRSSGKKTHSYKHSSGKEKRYQRNYSPPSRRESEKPVTAQRRSSSSNSGNSHSSSTQYKRSSKRY